MNTKMKRNIIKIGIVYIIIFFIIIIYLCYFVIFKSKNMVVHTQNRRMDSIENEVIRGDIYSSDGDLIATTDTNNNRNYPSANTYSHIVGYSQKGKTGVEAFANVELLRPNYTIESIVKRAFNEDKFQGRDVVLTVDSRLQKAADRALGKQKGAVIIIEPSTGKIKTLVSKPDYNPNKIVGDWDKLISDESNSPLLNRAVFGLYPPGSIFKVITTKAYWDKYNYEADMLYNCNGEITVDNNTIRCYNSKAHNKENLKEAFSDSCNTYFINMGLDIGTSDLKKTGEDLLFNHTLPTKIEHSKSQLLLNKNISDSELAATLIGQGKTLVTPLHMAIIASVIANEGVMMKPYVVDYSKDVKGHVKTKYLPEYIDKIMDNVEAEQLMDMMINVVEEGTGWRAKTQGLMVGGKTGTAQNAKNKDHSWFIGFAGSEKPEIVVSIVLENASEGIQASGIAKEIFEKYKEIR